MSSLSSLLDALRKEARPGIWSLGVNLARSGVVALQKQGPQEVELRVRASGRTVPLTVVLYPEDLAWECDCPGRVDPCEHVVAGALALDQAQKNDAPLASTQARWSRVVYRFLREGGGLALRRTLAHADGKEEPLTESLAAMLGDRAKAQSLQVEQHDLVVDRLLEKPVRGALPPERLEALLKVLAPARQVLLDGRPVAISDETVYPRATVVDAGEGQRLTVAPDPRVTEVPSPGVGLCTDALVRLGETSLGGPRWERLPLVRDYPAAQQGELSARVLPELAARIPVDVRESRLPPIDPKLRPRVRLEVEQVDGGLTVLPTLVYGAPPSVRIDGGRMVYLRGAVPVRDEALEQRLVHQLRDELNLLPGRRVTVTGPEVAPWAEKLRRFRGDVGGRGAQALFKDVELRPSLRLSTEASGGGLPRVRFELDFAGQGEVVSAEAVVRAWKEGLGLVPLAEGFAPLPLAWLDQHGQKVADLLAARGGDGKVATHALPQLGELCELFEHERPPALEKLRPLVEGFETLPEPSLPDDLAATLRPYQRSGASWLSFLKSAGLGGVLADDMGLGKTLQTLCVLGRRALVVCPTSVLANWEAEARRFRPSLSLNVYHGPARALDDGADLTLTTYAILRLDEPALTAVHWSTVVLDEAQAIKNPDSQVARAAFALQADFRLAVSGTPLENRLEELWSVMQFANPGLLGSRRDFDERVARPIADGDAAAAQALRRKLRPFVLRRLKKDVAPELPPRSEAVLRVTLDERERSIYDAVLAATRPEVHALVGEGGSMLKVLEALLRLRQAACHPALVPGQPSAATSSKVERLLLALRTAVDDGHRALVFSQWTSLLDLVEPSLRAAGISFDRLDGSTTNRKEVIERFQGAQGSAVLLMSLKAGGAGLNLTAADHVFLLDPWWNPAAEAQAADRAHRIGQARPVTIYRLVAQDTVEERILLLQDKKRALFEAALSEAGAGHAGALTKEDLLALVS